MLLNNTANNHFDQETTESEWGVAMAKLYQHELSDNTEETITKVTSLPEDNTHTEETIESDWGKEMARLYTDELANNTED